MACVRKTDTRQKKIPGTPTKSKFKTQQVYKKTPRAQPRKQVYKKKHRGPPASLNLKLGQVYKKNSAGPSEQVYKETPGADLPRSTPPPGWGSRYFAAKHKGNPKDLKPKKSCAKKSFGPKIILAAKYKGNTKDWRPKIFGLEIFRLEFFACKIQRKCKGFAANIFLPADLISLKSLTAKYKGNAKDWQPGIIFLRIWYITTD